jgi:hypothetical protein
MSALEVLPGGRTDALDRVVAAAKKMEEHEEIDRWEFADDVREAVDGLAKGQNGFDLSDRKAGPGRGKEGSGFYAAIDEVNSALYKAGVISVGRQSIVGAYTTAKSWPVDARVEGATYWAHHELRGREFDGRRNRVLLRLVQQNTTGRVGPKEVRLWKSSQRSNVVRPFLEQIESAVRGVLLRKGNPWDRVSDDDRDWIARMLREVAGEIVREEFGRK